MSGFEDGIILCIVCEQFRDLDRVTRSREPLDHHRSWTELCESAKQGCQLCKAFIDSHEKGKAFEEVTSEYFDRKIGFPASKLTWHWSRRSGPYYLRQEALLGFPHRDAINLWVDLYVQPDDPLASLVRQRPISESSNSKETYDLMVNWLLKCKKTHAECVWSEDCVLPTRVIDVGTNFSSIPRLLETSGETGSWVTLSHCWGGQHPLATTRSTLHERKDGIPIDSIPPTFRDAIEITRRLKVRYLWIDTLCIIQDDYGDWQKESTKMHEIYADAILCIAAAAAPNAAVGIFASADKERHLSRPLISLTSTSVRNGTRGEISLRPTLGSFPYTLRIAETLHARAWALQERILSPRILEFASSRIHWDCRSARLAENRPHSNPPQLSSLATGQDLFRFFPRLRKFKDHPNLDETPMPPLPRMPLEGHLVQWWYKTVLLDYVTRHITAHSDLLPAIAGVAQKFAERTSYHYFAGLWEEDFHRGLLWQSYHTIRREPSTLSPSWSWASAQLPWSGRSLDLSTYAAGNRAKVVKLAVTTESDKPYAQVAAACLTLEGYCRELHYWTGEIAPVYNSNVWVDEIQVAHRWTDDGPRAIPLKRAPLGRIICTLDRRPDDVNTCHEDVCKSNPILLQIARFSHQATSHSSALDDIGRIAGETVFALILEPAGENVEEYKRIGIAEIPVDDGIADGWETKRVSVV